MHKLLNTLVMCGILLIGGQATAQEEAQAENAAEPGNAVVSTENSEDTGAATQAEGTTTGDGNAESGAENAEGSENASETAANEKEVDPEILTQALLDKQLKEVSTNLDTLKEDTFTTKSRLLLLREEVLQRSVSGSRLQIRHKDDMGGQYELVQVVYAVDREPIFTRQSTTEAIKDIDDKVVFDRIMSPGSHQLTVHYQYKGKAWGVFRYMKDYTFRVESGYDFSIDEGKAAELVVTAAEQGGVFTPYEERPTVKFNYQQYELAPMSEETKDKLSATANK